MSSDDIESVTSAIIAQNYAHVFSIVILFYDHILTITPEIHYIWRSDRTATKALFLINRYFALIVNIVATVLEFVDLSEKSCRTAMSFRQFSVLLTAVIVAALLVLRIYALYSCSRIVLASLVVIGFTLGGVSGWQIAGDHSEITNSPGCHISYNRTAGIRTAVGWESLLIMDTLVFALTLKKTLKDRPLRKFSMVKSNDLVNLILRDGAVYYAVMVIVALSNTMTFYFAQPLIKGVMSTFASNISVTMMSRLMLNLHESAHYTGVSTFTDVFGAAFTTRLEIAAPFSEDGSGTDVIEFGEGISLDAVAPVDERGLVSLEPRQERTSLA